jgi:hypothetical protein
MHLRRVAFDQTRHWRIEDIVLGNGIHQIQIFWHFAPCRVENEGERYIFRFPGFQVLLECQAPVRLEKRIAEGQRNPIQGWFSPAFAVKNPNPVLCINAKDALPLQITTELTVEEA